jgi:PAS domain S-box-containing protein
VTEPREPAADIDRVRRLAQELEDQKRILEIAVEATRLGLWEIDLRAQTMSWSARNREIFGLVEGVPVTLEAYMAMIHPDDAERLRQTYRDVGPAGGDFEVEYRAVVPNGQLRWIHSRGRVIADDAGPKQIIGTSLDITDRKEADERKTLIVSELAHRAKNGLQVMMAIVTESGRHAASVEDFQRVLNERLAAMAASQDLVTAAGGRPIQLYDLAAQALTPFGLNRFEIEPDISELVVGGEVAAGLALLFHEMGTNAVKYGALSTPKGKVTLSAEDAGPGMIAMNWRERGGPEVKPVTNKGFGTRLLQAALRPQGGKVEPAFEPQGFSARMEFRAAR